jgi:hypothetical protein
LGTGKYVCHTKGKTQIGDIREGGVDALSKEYVEEDGDN